ncbi:MAG: hypothetical protein ACE5J3_09410 [Methanosarcinales archaeon]
MDLEKIMKTVFHTEVQKKVAIFLVKKILEGSPSEGKIGIFWNKIPFQEWAKTIGVTKPVLYKIFDHLQRIGMIKKEGYFVYLDYEFARSLHRLEKAWKKLVKPTVIKDEGL